MPEFEVTLTRTLTYSASLIVRAKTAEAAEDKVLERLSSEQPIEWQLEEENVEADSTEQVS